MDLMKSLIVILLSSVLVNNYVLSRFLGICPFLGVSKKLDQATGMGISVTAVMLLATAMITAKSTQMMRTTRILFVKKCFILLPPAPAENTAAGSDPAGTPAGP